MGVRSVMIHREEVLEVSKVQIGKSGVVGRLESRTRKRVGRRCWKVLVSDTLPLTLCLFRMEPYLFIGNVSFKLNRNLVWERWEVALCSWKQDKFAVYRG